MHSFTAMGVRCEVAAPSVIPKGATDRVHTDKLGPHVWRSRRRQVPNRARTLAITVGR
jgi:hypothetical protein